MLEIVGVEVGLGVDDVVAELLGECVGEFSAGLLVVGVGTGVGVREALVFIATPLFQISVFPDLMQVYLIFEIVFVEFTFEHLVPEIDTEFAGISDVKKMVLIKIAIRRNLLRNIR